MNFLQKYTIPLRFVRSRLDEIRIFNLNHHYPNFKLDCATKLLFEEYYGG